jgi:hypothetical protein
VNWHEFWSISYLFSPLLVGLATHGFSIKFGWLGSLTRAIDGGKTYRGKRIFGENKTYRGVFAVALGTALGFGIQTFVLHGSNPFKGLSCWNIGPALWELDF